MILDTHAFLWFILDDPQLTSNSRGAIELGSNTILISPATPWEIAIKYSTGKLTLGVRRQGIYRKLGLAQIVSSNENAWDGIFLRH